MGKVKSEKAPEKAEEAVDAAADAAAAAGGEDGSDEIAERPESPVPTHRLLKLPEGTAAPGTWLCDPATGTSTKTGPPPKPGHRYVEDPWLQPIVQHPPRRQEPAAVTKDADGVLVGEGTEVFPDGSSYEGQFSNSKRHGQGKLRMKDGSTYEGGFVDGHFGGAGTLRLASGTVLAGNWAGGVLCGPDARIEHTSGAVFKGALRGSRRVGEGTTTFADGSALEQTFPEAPEEETATGGDKGDEDGEPEPETGEPQNDSLEVEEKPREGAKEEGQEEAGKGDSEPTEANNNSDAALPCEPWEAVFRNADGRPIFNITLSAPGTLQSITPISEPQQA